MKGTRREVLFQLEQWSRDEQDKRVFWLNGLAGTGKSAIAQTFAEMSFADGKLGASFFCSRDSNDRSNLRSIFPTLAFQLAHRYPRFREELLPVLTASPDVGREILCSQIQKLIVGPFQGTQIQTLIIVDALDECRDEEPTSALLSVLSHYVDKIPLVKFLITGRPEPRIHDGFHLESLQPHADVLRLHEVRPSSVDSDVKLFLKTQFAEIAKKRKSYNLGEDWPGSDNIDILCKKAAGFFIYATTVVKFVASSHHSPNERLALIVSLPQDTSHEGRLGIDLLYTQVLEQAFCDVDSQDHEVYSHFRSVVGTVLLIFHPLSINTLSDLLRSCSTQPRIFTSLRTLHSVFLVPDNTEDPIQIFHKSFPDFITDQQRCTNHKFFIDPSTHHKEILLSCFDVMKERLKRNICNLDAHAILSEVKDLPTLKSTFISDSLEYACCFWTKHLVKITSSSDGLEEVYKAIDNFFTTGFLCWIEVLILIGNLDISVYALNDIEEWYELVSYAVFAPKLLFISIQIDTPCKWTSDSNHFILENFDAIQSSPAKIYTSALTLCPSSSWLHQCYTADVRVVVGSAKWGTCIRTVSCQNVGYTLAYWDNIIAINSSEDIIIFDALTGSQIATLSGHTGYVCSLTFSSDGAFLVSGSVDKTIKLWGVQTGVAIKTFYGHTDLVQSVSISPDKSMIASGSGDETIRLWNIETGDCHIMEGHRDFVSTVAFSSTNPQLFLSSSGDNTVRQWGIDGHQTGSPITGYSVAFSPDGTQFVSLNHTTVTIRNTNSGMTVAEFNLANSVDCCCFSPDGRLIAVAAHHAIYIWDITSPSPCLIQTLIGHTEIITSLIFPSSLSLISASRDKSIKFWQIGTSPADPIVPNSEPTPLTLAPIRSVSLQAKDSLAFSLDSEGVVRTWDILTGFCKKCYKTQAKGIYHGDMQLISDRLIIALCRWGEKEIYIWDAERGRLKIVDTLCQFTNGLRIIGDGSRVLQVDKESIQAWSIWTGESAGKERLEKNYNYCFDPLRMDGSKVLVQSGESSAQGWDFGIPGSTPIQFSETSSDRPHLNCIDVRNWSETSLVGIEDSITGKEVFQLYGRYAKPSVTQWDGQYLIAGYKSGEVLILDFGHVLS